MDLILFIILGLVCVVTVEIQIYINASNRRIFRAQADRIEKLEQIVEQMNDKLQVYK